MSQPTEKAKFKIYNKGATATFHVQFNPAELKIDDSALWKESETKHKSRPKLTYDKAAPSMLNMKLYFDTTDTLESVDSKYVKHLRAATDATYEYEVKAGGEAKEGAAEGGEADEDKKKVIRPPYVDFEWKDIKFQGVMEKVSVTYLMFKADGTPLRAQVDVTLKEGIEKTLKEKMPDIRGVRDVTDHATGENPYY